MHPLNDTDFLNMPSQAGVYFGNSNELPGHLAFVIFLIESEQKAKHVNNNSIMFVCLGHCFNRKLFGHCSNKKLFSVVAFDLIVHIKVRSVKTLLNAFFASCQWCKIQVDQCVNK